MNEFEAVALAAEINLELWRAEQARRESVEAELMALETEFRTLEHNLALAKTWLNNAGLSPVDGLPVRGRLGGQSYLS